MIKSLYSKFIVCIMTTQKYCYQFERLKCDMARQDNIMDAGNKAVKSGRHSSSFRKNKGDEGSDGSVIALA